MIVCIDEKFYLFALDILYGFFVKKTTNICSYLLVNNNKKWNIK